MKEIATVRVQDGVNVRAQPSQTANRIDRVGEGEEFEILGRETPLKTMWFKVRTRSGDIGYIAAAYTTIRIEPDPPVPAPADQSHDDDDWLGDIAAPPHETDQRGVAPFLFVMIAVIFGALLVAWLLT